MSGRITLLRGRRKMLLRFVAAMIASMGALAVGLSSAMASDYPNRPIHVIVGPSSDVTARIIADRLNGPLGEAVVIENRGGGGGEVAVKTVSAADPDGYTLLYATASYTLNTALGIASYNFVKDFEPISLFGLSSFTLLVSPKLGVHNLKELIALAKAKPGTINCASSGIGTPAHMGCEMFNAMAGVKTVHVPFRNVNAAVNGMLGGYVQMMFAVSVNARPQVESKTLQAIAITSPKQSAIMPGVPTMEEAGLPGFIITGWGSLVAPRGTPKPVITRLNTEVQKLLHDPKIGPLIRETGMEDPGVETPEEFRTFIKNDIDRWNKMIDLSGVARGRPK
jgi:tripartite-type tricarboxylate transporter receptor subunit TctC